MYKIIFPDHYEHDDFVQFEADGMKAASSEENDLSKLVIKSCK